MVVSVPYSMRTARGGRAQVLALASFGALGLCLLRLMFLQLVRGRELTQASESNHTQVLVERAPRGRILDRNGVVLADDQPVFVALFSPLGLGPTDFQQVLTRLSGILKVAPAELEHRIFAAVRAKSMMRISDRLTRSQAFLILQDRIHLPGISLTIEEQRYYPKITLASHVLGYVGQITDQELTDYSELGYHPGDYIGKIGLERLYDPTLHGQDGGFLIEVDARGRQVRVIRHVLPQAGKDITLTLDSKVQQIAEDRLRQSEHPGAAVMIDPQSGELLAMASAPGFDPNLFLPLGDSTERQKILTDPENPLYNRAMQGVYPPGSTFKIITTLAALQEHALDPEKTVFCNGSYVLGRERRVFHCWKPHGHGSVNFMKAMAQSCDVYFYELGYAIGPEPMEQMATLFGLNRVTGVDLPHELHRLLPMARKAAAPKAADRHWQGGDTLNYAIGQGLLLVTPLQMATMISTVANEGSIWQPFLVQKAQRFGEEPDRLGAPHMLNHLVFPASTWNLLRDSLHEVVRRGTGVAAQIPGIEVAGKTGTAQVSKEKDHAWFVSYAPVDNPKVACAVLVEHGGHGGSVAAPIAHDMMAQALGAVKEESGPGEARVESD